MQVLQMIDQIPLPQKVIITPHHLEFELLTGKPFKIQQEYEHKAAILRTVATDLHINILLKGPQSILVSDRGEVQVNANGNAGMTVGGSGDVLAGLVAGLISQKVAPYDACLIASFTLGKAADQLFKEKGYFYSSSDLANEIPYVLKDFVS
jgi:NAD(P)H-hydrate epimerase